MDLEMFTYIRHLPDLQQTENRNIFTHISNYIVTLQQVKPSKL